MSLFSYRHQRKKISPEPVGREKKKIKSQDPIFVIQKHHATRLHYDFRLEVDGVLMSWAVPKGLPETTSDKRLAIMVEDHPYEYKDFEGVIPPGNYGAGTVLIWDKGTYHAIDEQEDAEKSIKKGVDKGEISFVLEGEKSHGAYSLIRLKKDSSNKSEWIFIKRKSLSTSDKKSKAPLEEKYSLLDLSQYPYHKNPPLIKPMLATLIDAPFNDNEWIFEIKWDGFRALTYLKGKDVKIYSRTQNLLNGQFPSIVKELQKLKLNAVLDGEIVLIDENGKANFQLLQNIQSMDRFPKGCALYYFIFDILYYKGYELIDAPLIERKKLLATLFTNKKGFLRYNDHVEMLGVEFFKEAEKNGLEGIIGKKKLSAYVISKRVGEWVKIKTKAHQEVVICGFTEPKGSRKGFGALIVGIYKDDELKFAGHVGGGFTENSIKELKKKFMALIQKKCPFEKVPKTNTAVTWIKPHLICEVEFQEWTQDGRMRQPIFRGLREDKPPKSVKKEEKIPSDKVKKEASKLPLRTKSSLERRKDDRDTKIVTKHNSSELGEEQSAIDRSNFFLSKDDFVRKGSSKEKSTRWGFSNLDKIYWPDEKITKGDLIKYYQTMAPHILPHVKNHPVSLHRFPNGIHEKSFFQKDMGEKTPPGLETVEIFSESTQKKVHYLVIKDKKHLLYAVNLGSIEIHSFLSTVKKLENPVFLLIDLDPLDIDFKAVIETALVTHDCLEELGLPHYCKTSGATGLHICIPLNSRYTYEEVKNFAHLLVLAIHKMAPTITSIERSPKKREKKVYLDYLQNRMGQTIVTPYSVRPRPHAPVSTPLEWKEVKEGLDPTDFTIHTIGKRFEKKGDLFLPVVGPGVNFKKVLPNIEKML